MSCVRPLRTLSCPLVFVGQRSSIAGGCESTFPLRPQILRLRPSTPGNAFGQQQIIVHFRGHGTTSSLWTGAAYAVALDLSASLGRRHWSRMRSSLGFCVVRVVECCCKSVLLYRYMVGLLSCCTNVSLCW